MRIRKLLVELSDYVMFMMKKDPTFKITESALVKEILGVIKGLSYGEELVLLILEEKEIINIHGCPYYTFRTKSEMGFPRGKTPADRFTKPDRNIDISVLKRETSTGLKLRNNETIGREFGMYV